MLLRGPLNIEFILVSVNNAHYKLFVDLLYHPRVLLLLWMTILVFWKPRILSNFVLLTLIFFNNQHFLYSRLSNLSCSFSLTQVVAQPNHVSPAGKSTLIDLVLMSTPQSQLKN